MYIFEPEKIFSKEFVNTNPGFICITHNDNDGDLSAIEIAYTESKLNEQRKVSYNDIYNIDYENIIDNIINIVYRYLAFNSQKGGIRIFLTDLSLKLNDLVYIYNIISTRTTEKIYLIWYDHHVSSYKDILNKDEAELHKIMSINNLHWNITANKEECAAMLIYRQLINLDEFTELKTNNAYNVVSRVSDWDTWTHKIKDTIPYNYALESFGHCSGESGYNNWMKLFTENNDPKINEELVKYGSFIEKYKINEYKTRFKKSIYMTEFHGYTAKCICSQEHKSLVFSEPLDPNILYIVWHFNGNKFSYSLYSSTNSNIDCRVIAESYGGGGHTHAAGFMVDNIIV